jgi:hypothetical protein
VLKIGPVEFNFTDYIIWKFIALGALAFFGNFFYTLFTGRSLEQDRRDKQAAEGSDGRSE